MRDSMSYMLCRMVSTENGGGQFSRAVASTLLPHLMREMTQKTRTKNLLARAWKLGSSQAAALSQAAEMSLMLSQMRARVSESWLHI